VIRIGTTLNQAVLRRTFGCFPSGVTAVCGSVGGRPIGLAVSSFTSVSLEPPLSSICIANTSKTWPSLRCAGLIGVSVLNEMQGAICRQLSGNGEDRFMGVPWDTSPAGAVLIERAAAWLECTVDREISAGDHRVVLLRIHAVQANPEIAPLIHHASRFRRLGAEPVAVHPPRPDHQIAERLREDSDGSRFLDRIAQIVAASGS
jgi:flavin reductase (DIM6/NTAB) family NADH-FMN oxidoreductase RutF